MDIEVTKYPSSPKEESFGNEGDPSIDTKPPPEREMNIMSQGKLDHLWKSCSFPIGIQTRLLETDKTIASTRPSKVAVYEAAFQADLHLPIHSILRRILAYYNVCPARVAKYGLRLGPMTI